MKKPRAFPQPSVSLKVLFAAAARKAVILRRGPREHFHLIAWDLESDRFERGQWIRGVVRLSDLSADGTRLLYWVAQYHREKTRLFPSYNPEPDAANNAPRMGRRAIPRYLRDETPSPAVPQTVSFSTWTAISKPPYFTALAFWPSMGTWTGGGHFGADGSIYVAEFNLDPIANAAPPDVPVHGIALKDKLGAKRIARLGDVERYPHQSDVALALYLKGAHCIHWVDLDVRTGVTFAYDGQIFRSRVAATASPENIVEKSELIADFSTLTFEQIPPVPSALQW
jgi:hypothetical protein